MERRRRLILVIVVALATIGYTFYTSRQQPAPEPEPQDAAQVQNAATETAIQALGKLAVKDRAPRDGYNRSQFGSGWAEVAGCDVRNRILQRDLDSVQLADDVCAVLAGVLQSDPYTSQAINFKRGPGTSQAVQIDHVVALSDAWQKGAQDLGKDKRRQFSNDPLNLLAVDGPANMEKGDSDAADWLPPNKSYHCRYVARQIAVKVKYILWATRAELNAMKRVLGTCPNQRLPIEEPTS